MSAFAGVTLQPRAAADRAGGRLVQATIVTVALAWSFSVLSFLDVKEAALWGGTLALALLNTLAGRSCVAGFRALSPCWIALIYALFTGLLRAPVPYFSLLEVLRITPIVLFTTLAYDRLRDSASARNVMRGVIAAATGAAILALMQYANWIPGLFPRFAGYDQAMYSVFGNQGLLGGFLATAIICLAGLHHGHRRGAGDHPRARHVAWAVGTTLLATLLLSGSRGALIAFFSGGIALVCLRVITPRAAFFSLFGTLLLAILLILLVDAAPWARWAGTLGHEDTGGNLRPWIWAGSLRLFQAHPLVGVGIGNYGYAIPLRLGEEAMGRSTGFNTLTTDHAHMDVLELLCEMGLAGLGLLVWLSMRLRTRNPVALSALIALATFSCFHPAWHSAPHAFLFLLLYAMCVEAKVDTPGRRWLRAVTPVTGLVAITGCLVFVYLVLQPSFLLCRAEDLHLAGRPAAAAYRSATEAGIFNPEAHESFGIYALEQGDVERARRELARAKAGSDTGRIYRLLAMAAEAAGDTEAACRWYRQCAARWPWDESIAARIAERCGE